MLGAALDLSFFPRCKKDGFKFFFFSQVFPKLLPDMPHTGVRLLPILRITLVHQIIKNM